MWTESRTKPLRPSQCLAVSTESPPKCSYQSPFRRTEGSGFAVQRKKLLALFFVCLQMFVDKRDFVCSRCPGHHRAEGWRKWRRNMKLDQGLWCSVKARRRSHTLRELVHTHLAERGKKESGKRERGKREMWNLKSFPPNNFIRFYFFKFNHLCVGHLTKEWIIFFFSISSLYASAKPTPYLNYKIKQYYSGSREFFLF